MSELRTRSRGRDRSHVRTVQGRLSIQFGDEEEAGDIAPAQVPATAATAKLRRVPAKAIPPAPVFHPLAYRGVVAAWTVEWRERWGLRANELEEQGLSWRDAEAQAFVEVWKELREHSAGPAPSEFASSAPERN